MANEICEQVNLRVQRVSSASFEEFIDLPGGEQARQRNPYDGDRRVDGNYLGADFHRLIEKWSRQVIRGSGSLLL